MYHLVAIIIVTHVPLALKYVHIISALQYTLLAIAICNMYIYSYFVHNYQYYTAYRAMRGADPGGHVIPLPEPYQGS